jgi:hypothetical protein
MIFLVSLVFLGQGSEMDIIQFCNLSESMSRDKRNHSQGHVTSTNKVTLHSYSVDLYLFDIRDPKNLRNKKKDNCSSVTSTRVRKGHAQGHVTLTYKVTLDSYSVDLYLFDIRDPKNLRNKKKIIALASLEPELGKVTLRVT